MEIDLEDIVGSTNRLRAEIASAWGNVSPGALKVAVVLTLVHRCRLLDICMKEYVHILYSVEGRDYMRAHNGTLFLYDNGAYSPFVGIFGVSTLGRVRRVMQRVEGLLRLLDRGVHRARQSVLHAALFLLHASPNDEAWLRKIEDAVLDAVPGDNDHPCWTKTLANAVAKAGSTLQVLLAGRRLVSYLIE